MQCDASTPATRCSVTGTVYTLSVGGQPIWTQTSSGAHVWGDWDSRTVADGPATLVANVRDASGKTGTGTLALTVRNGTSPPPPTASFTSPGAGATVNGTTPVGMAVSGGTPNYTYQLSIDGGAPAFNQTTASTSATYNWPTTSVSDGSHTLTLSVTDGGGRTSTATRTVTVQNTTPPPVASFTSPADGATVSGATLVGMAVSGGSPSYTYQLSIDGGAPVFNQTTPNTSASYSWSTTGVSNGSHTLTLTVTDAGSRTSTATRTVTVNNASGGTFGVALTSPAPGSTVRGTVAVNVWVDSGTSTAPYTYTISVGGTVVGTTTSSGKHVTFSWNTTQTANGTRSLTATITDAAGRTGSQTISVLVQNP